MTPSVMAAAWLAASCPEAEATVKGVIRDALTRAPVVAVRVSTRRASSLSDEEGAFVVCADRGDSLRLRRVGYRPAIVAVERESRASVSILLAPAAARLAQIDVRAEVDVERDARAAATVDAATLRRRGAATVGDALASLPFVAARTARGATALSMRGARPEQVVVTLDGLPLNDAATGRADVGDIPVVAIGSITAVPGADPIGAGSGAIGGVLALNSGGAPVVALTAGAFGLAQLDGAGVVRVGGGSLRFGGPRVPHETTSRSSTAKAPREATRRSAG